MNIDPLMTLDRLGPIGDQLGRGGQATVFDLPAEPNIVFKRYNSGLPINADALDSLIDWRNTLNGQDTELLDAHSCWPQARITEEGATVGVIFRRAPEHFLVTLTSGNVRLRELQYLFLVERSRKIGVDVPAPLMRVQIVGQLAELMSFLQDHEVVHGDLSMKNVLWTKPKTGVPAVFLLDCDGMRVAGSAAPLPQVTTPGWTDPRIISKEIGEPDAASDVYGLGLCFYRCYYGFLGEHDPSSSTLRVPEWPPIETDLMNLTASTLSPTSQRPTARAWVQALGSLVANLNDDATALGSAYNNGEPPTQNPPVGSAPAQQVAVVPTTTESESITHFASPHSTDNTELASVTQTHRATPHLAKLFFAVSIGLLAGAIIALIVVLAVL